MTLSPEWTDRVRQRRARQHELQAPPPPPLAPAEELYLRDVPKHNQPLLKLYREWAPRGSSHFLRDLAAHLRLPASRLPDLTAFAEHYAEDFDGMALANDHCLDALKEIHKILLTRSILHTYAESKAIELNDVISPHSILETMGRVQLAMQLAPTLNAANRAQL